MYLTIRIIVEVEDAEQAKEKALLICKGVLAEKDIEFDAGITVQIELGD